MAAFLRRLLVRSFESSVYGFKKTPKNIIASMENIKKRCGNCKKFRSSLRFYHDFRRRAYTLKHAPSGSCPFKTKAFLLSWFTKSSPPKPPKGNIYRQKLSSKEYRDKKFEKSCLPLLATKKIHLQRVIIEFIDSF